MTNVVKDGTASATNGVTTVEFEGVEMGMIRPGGLFIQGGKTGVIASVDGDEHTAELEEGWGGDTAVDAAYMAVTIPEDAELAYSTRRLMTLLNGSLLSFAEMTGDNAPNDGDTIAWDDITGGWVAVSTTNLMTRAGDGTVGAPGIAYAADQDTGFWRSGDNQMDWVTGGATRMRALANGRVLIGTTTDSGAALSVGGSLNASGDVSTSGSGNFVLPAANFVRWASGSLIGGQSDGVIKLSNGANSDFGRLQFGGTTSAFPALKRSGATVQARLADDSGYATIRALNIQLANGTFLADGSDGVCRLTNAAGTDFGRLQFGGTTSSFPALKRSATTIAVRLADDSDDASLSAYHLTLNSAGAIRFGARNLFSAPADGVYLLCNAAGTDLNRLQFGGTTSAFPSIKRDSANLALRLADDSGYCGVTAGNFTLRSDTGQMRVNNAAGTGVLAIATLKGWLGSGSNVTDAAIGSIGSQYFYVNNSNRIAANFDVSGTVSFNQSGAGNVQLLSGLSGGASQAAAHLYIQGSGYAAMHWLDSNAYYIYQNSAGRTLRMASGNDPLTGVQLSAGATSWSAISRRHLKTDLEPVTDALRRIARHTPGIGRYKTDDEWVRRAFLFREDADEYWPYAAHGDDALSLADYVPLLMQGIKDLSAIVELQDHQISSIQANMGTN